MINIVIDGLDYDAKNDYFFSGIPHYVFARLCKMRYTNKNRFLNRYIKVLKAHLKAHGCENRIPSIETLVQYYDMVQPFTYSEAFSIKDITFKNVVFSTINVGEMIASLGHERIQTEGKNVSHRRYKADGTYDIVNYDVIYELHKVDCTKLLEANTTDNRFGMRFTDNFVYAVKCWCTSTNKEHWLWVETEYALKGPLEAIASTVRVYKNMLPHITAIKRQGDVFLFEMDKEIFPSGEIVPLNADTYFKLLVAQS